MGIKITVGNYPVEVGTPAEAAALLAELNKYGSGGHRPMPPRDTPPAIGKDQEELKMLFDLLESIKTGGPQGASSKVVAHALDVQEKGIGSRLTWIRRMLNGLHFDDGDVFVRIKIPRVGSFWKPGEKFDAAHNAVRQKIGG